MSTIITLKTLRTEINAQFLRNMSSVSGHSDFPRIFNGVRSENTELNERLHLDLKITWLGPEVFPYGQAVWQNGKSLNYRWCIGSPSLHTESLINGEDGWRSRAIPSASSLVPSHLLLCIIAHFNPLSLFTETKFWQLVVGAAVELGRSLCHSGPRFLSYEMRCWNRQFQASLLALWHCE